MGLPRFAGGSYLCGCLAAAGQLAVPQRDHQGAQHVRRGRHWSTACVGTCVTRLVRLAGSCCLSESLAAVARVSRWQQVAITLLMLLHQSMSVPVLLWAGQWSGCPACLGLEIPVTHSCAPVARSCASAAHSNAPAAEHLGFYSALPSLVPLPLQPPDCCDQNGLATDMAQPHSRPARFALALGARTKLAIDPSQLPLAEQPQKMTGHQLRSPHSHGALPGHDRHADIRPL